VRFKLQRRKRSRADALLQVRQALHPPSRFTPSERAGTSHLIDEFGFLEAIGGVVFAVGHPLCAQCRQGGRRQRQRSCC
jgi:hypothetical protein